MAKYIVIHSVRVCTEFAPETFGRLTTIGPKFRLRGVSFQACICECGIAIIRRQTHLEQGYTNSCGCMQKALAAESQRTHGQTGSPEYLTWARMHSRCTNPKNARYVNYGKRGITVCARWEKFSNFFEDMGLRPSRLHSLDRRNNDGNYEKSNCRWATKLEQANNKQTNRLIVIDGQTDTLANWCRKYGQKYCNVIARINNYGWDPLRAVTTAVKTQNTKGTTS